MWFGFSKCVIRSIRKRNPNKNTSTFQRSTGRQVDRLTEALFEERCVGQYIHDCVRWPIKNRTSERSWFCVFFKQISLQSPGYLQTCLPANLYTSRLVNLPTWRPVNLSICQPVDLSTCRYFDLSSCRPVNMYTCQPVSYTIPFLLRFYRYAFDIGGDNYYVRPVNLSTCRPVNLATCLPVDMSTSRPFNLSTCLSVSMSTCQPVDLYDMHLTFAETKIIM